MKGSNQAYETSFGFYLSSKRIRYLKAGVLFCVFCFVFSLAYWNEGKFANIMNNDGSMHKNDRTATRLSVATVQLSDPKSTSRSKQKTSSHPSQQPKQNTPVLRTRQTKQTTQIRSTGLPKQKAVKHLTRGEENVSHQKFTQVSIELIHERFKNRTHPSCNNTCSSDNVFCNSDARDKPSWDKVVQSKRLLKTIPLFKENEYIFPWEKDYFSHPPLTDYKLLPDVSKAKVTLLGMKEGSGKVAGSVVKLKVGAKLLIRLDLVDGYGNPRRFGGDQVRAWLTSSRLANNIRSSSGNGAAGMVKDFGNGTYLATVTPVWKGIAKINIALVHPREYIRMTLLHSRLGSHRFIVGMFQKGAVKEATICHTTPNIPGRPCVCNLTEFNGVNYYCGRPLNPRLSCGDWKSVWPSEGVPYLQLSPAEKKLEGIMSRPMTDALIPNNLTIDAEENASFEANLPPCPNGKNYTMTWTDDWPKGFWHNGSTWKSLLCKEPAVTSQRAISCLNGHKILIIGDSNGVRLVAGVLKLIPMKPTRRGSWPFRQDFARNNINLKFRPHEYPLFLQHKWVPVLNYGGVGKEIDKIPSTGNYVIIVHYYYHISSSHLSALYTRLKILKNSISALVKRNPNGLIALRGPHIATVAWQYNHMFSGDILGWAMIQMYKEMFAELKDHVVYLDAWEMSMGIENTGVHPPDFLPQSMIKSLIALRCST